MLGVVGHTGGLKKPAPGVDDPSRLFQMPVGLSCLERRHLAQKVAKIMTLYKTKHLQNIIPAYLFYPSDKKDKKEKMSQKATSILTFS